MSEQIKHECGIALIRLLKPLEYYQYKYGTWKYGLNKLYLLMEKQHNRGQDGAGVASIKLDMPPGEPYIFRTRSAEKDPIMHVRTRMVKAFSDTREKHPAEYQHGEWVKRNVLFAGERSPSSEIAVCLIDLDTVGPMSLAFELGDAWRSWCNRSGEDSPQAHVDLEVMRASLEGYGEGIGHPLSAIERRALLGAVEWISLELAARFLSDALDESYFGWNSRWYPTRGEHNLVRARGQFALHEAFLKTRQERAEILVVAA